MIELRTTHNRTTNEHRIHADCYAAFVHWQNAPAEHSIDLVYDDGQVFGRRCGGLEWVGGAFGGPAA